MKLLGKQTSEGKKREKAMPVRSSHRPERQHSQTNASPNVVCRDKAVAAWLRRRNQPKPP
jgi:hypothetical protein